MNHHFYNVGDQLVGLLILAGHPNPQEWTQIPEFMDTTQLTCMDIDQQLSMVNAQFKKYVMAKLPNHKHVVQTIPRKPIMLNEWIGQYRTVVIPAFMTTQ